MPAVAGLPNNNAIAASAVDFTEYTYENLEYIVDEDETIIITDCDESATEVVIPAEIDGLSVTSIGDMAFYGCSRLTDITIPDSITSIGDSAFYDCLRLTDITIPDSVTSIEKSVFYNCSGLVEINIPDSVISIGDYAFSGCSNLADITIPDNVTSICCFSGCTSLTSITIPDSVTSIGSAAFVDCSNLKDVTILNPNCEIHGSSSTICNYYSENGYCYFNGTIHGYENSTAQAYAEKYGYKFEPLGDAPATADGDANGDGRIDVFDLCLLKQMLIQKK